MKYIPAIDGLRALAVLSVIAYHLNIQIHGHNVFQGGFFGVDVFFVISGYLITSIFKEEISKTGNIKINEFYLRRIRRILPILLTALLFSCSFIYTY